MFFCVVKLRDIKFVAVALAIFTLLFFNLNNEVVVAETFLGISTKQIPIYCVENDRKEVALTFDAAWGSDKTQKILDVLKENDINATFFLVGMWVDKNEDLVKNISSQGLEIGTHSNTHPDLTKLSVEQMKLELEVSKNKIENLTNKKVLVFRAPYGAYNNNLISVAKNLNLQTIQWDVDSLDWKGISAEEILSNVFKKVQSGSIILCHNNSDHIVDALPSLILGLKNRGYKFKTVSELILKDNYKIDNNGKQVAC